MRLENYCLKKLTPADVSMFIVVGANTYPVFHPIGYWKVNMNKRITFGSSGLNVTQQMFGSSVVSIKHLLSHDKWMCNSVFVLMCVYDLCVAQSCCYLLTAEHMVLLAVIGLQGDSLANRTAAEPTATSLSCPSIEQLQTKWQEGESCFIISVYFSPEREMMMNDTEQIKQVGRFDKYKTNLIRTVSGLCSNACFYLYLLVIWISFLTHMESITLIIIIVQLAWV